MIPAEPGSAVNVHEFRLNPLSDTEAVAAGTKVKNNQMAWETAMAIKVPSLAPGTEKTFSYTLYTGPREYDRLKAIGAENGGNQFHLLMDFGKWFGWVAEGLLRLMKWMEPHLGIFEILEGQQLGVVHHRHHFGDQVDFLADHRQEHAPP